MTQNEQAFNPHQQASSWSGFRLSLWPLIMYLIDLVQAYLSQPFVGLETPAQNLAYCIIAASPFWVIILAFLAMTWRDIVQN